jgi:hypothetical protein
MLALGAGCGGEPALGPDARALTLDAPVAFAVTAIYPQGPYQAGDEIVLVGRGFGDPPDCQVFIDDEIVPILPGSNDGELDIRLPIISLPKEGAEVPISVTFRGGIVMPLAPIQLVQIPITIPAGTLAVGLEAFPSGTVTQGHEYVFGFRIEAFIDLDETFALAPTVPPGWRAVMVSDATGVTELPAPAQVAIAQPPPGRAVTMTHAFVRVTVPTSATVADAFVKLDVISVHNGSLSGTSGRVDVPFNVPSPPGQTLLVAIEPPIGGEEIGDTFVFTVPTTASVPLDGFTISLLDLKAISYTLSLSWKDTATDNHGWTASWGGAPGITAGWPREQKTISLGSPGSDPEKVTLIGAAGATENTLVITVRSTSEPDTDYAIFNLNVVPLPP